MNIFQQCWKVVKKDKTTARQQILHLKLFPFVTINYRNSNNEEEIKKLLLNFSSNINENNVRKVRYSTENFERKINER